MVLGYGATILAHGKTNASFTEGKSVVDTFSSEGAGAARSLHGGDKHMLILGGGSVHDLSSFLDRVLEEFLSLAPLSVVLAFEFPSVSSFNWIFHFLHEFRELVSEVSSRDGELFAFFVSNSNLAGGPEC